MRVLEHEAVVVVNEALSLRALGDDYVVALKLEMKVLDRLDTPRLHNGDAVDKVFRLDQHAVEIHRMVRRNPQIALRHIVVERAGLDTDRQNVFAPRDKAAGITSPPDPFDRPRRARYGHHFVADLELFDARVAALHSNERTAAVAGRRTFFGDQRARPRAAVVG